jgi:hypothetical protein
LIPAVAHFIWFGRDFPWVNVVALRSAAVRGGLERIVLHHADDLSATPWWGQVLGVPGLEARRLEPESLLARTPQGGSLVPLYRRRTAPAARANMVRAAILWLEGGVYLDLDTVTVASLQPLCTHSPAFCGVERIVFPTAVVRSRNPVIWSRALLKTALRDLLRRLPRGWALFRQLETRYPVAVNNAVVGAEAGHPLLEDLMQRMVTLDPRRQIKRYALGTHLLEQAVREYEAEDLLVYLPAAFYPLGPEISEHWFRFTRRPELEAVLSADTRVVHWYASVRTRPIVPLVDAEYVRRNASRQLFSALTLPFVE